MPTSGKRTVVGIFPVTRIKKIKNKTKNVLTSIRKNRKDTIHYNSIELPW
jgi:hypothetical protein